jgi:hypothetical protein
MDGTTRAHAPETMASIHYSTQANKDSKIRFVAGWSFGRFGGSVVIFPFSIFRRQMEGTRVYARKERPLAHAMF